MPFLGSRHQLRHILNDINFQVQPGESVGLIGVNGAGKSSLLKLIAATSMPSEGTLTVNGRVSALLELGFAFQPEFTGRQNVILMSQLLGYTADESKLAQHEVEMFAEIGEYIEQPLRTYSTGMRMRLAFSIATAIRPDILIIDEALSVGDVYFQHKSFERIRKYQQLGTTLLIVSHDKQAILSICSRAILLSGGRIAMTGSPEEVFDYYNAQLADHQDQQINIGRLARDNSAQTVSGTGEASILEVALRNAEGDSVETVAIDSLAFIEVIVAVNQPIESLTLGFGIKDRTGQLMFGTNTFHTGQSILSPQVGTKYKFTAEIKVALGVGTYSLSLALVKNHSHVEANFHWIDRAMLFDVFNRDKPTFLGCSWNPVAFTIDRV
jgi:lipopolysaccharide transport system ATP-binding protein